MDWTTEEWDAFEVECAAKKEAKRQRKEQRREEAAAAKEAVATTAAHTSPEPDIPEGEDSCNLDYEGDLEASMPVQTQLQVIPDITQTKRKLFASLELNLQLRALLKSSQGKKPHPQAEVLNGASRQGSTRDVPYLWRAVGAMTEAITRAQETSRAEKKQIQIGTVVTKGAEKGNIRSGRAGQGCMNIDVWVNEAVNAAKINPIHVIKAINRAVGNPLRAGGIVTHAAKGTTPATAVVS